MNLIPSNQTNLYGLDKNLRLLISLYKNNKLPNKILLTGQKGIGKCTLAYHLINFVLSENEEYSYDEISLKINELNKSFKLIKNNVNPNFQLIDITSGTKSINIDQIRDLIKNINKSSFNNRPNFILIDNTEYLNKNSINALLKDLEEPNNKTYFILINNQKKLLPTLISRCINFNIHLSYANSIKVINKLLNDDVFNHINHQLLDYYFTPGNIFNLCNFANSNELNIKDLDLKDFLKILIKNNYFKKNISLKYIFYDYIELCLKNTSKKFKNNYYNYFVAKINELKKFNLDEESFFIEFKDKILNG
tara:strand:- start:324 stop:1244 length:921 start_codon:yes stop_codon:yes gene_type:complete